MFYDYTAGTSTNDPNPAMPCGAHTLGIRNPLASVAAPNNVYRRHRQETTSGIHANFLGSPCLQEDRSRRDPPQYVEYSTAKWRPHFLETAKRLAPHHHSSTIPARYTLKAWKHHYYYVLRCCGITRQDGIVAHGLRHGYANLRYETLAGQPSPVRGGKSGQLSRDADRKARLDVSRQLGHARASITSAYCGALRRTDSQKQSR